MINVAESMQKGASNFSFILGKALFYTGAAGLFTMAVVGTVAIDIVLLSYARKSHDRFLSGMIFAGLFFGNRSDMTPALIASPITTAVAVVLSVCLGVPGVGLALLAGWLAAGLLFAAGKGLVGLSEVIEPNGAGMSSCFA